jgi:hypothetical protein
LAPVMAGDRLTDAILRRGWVAVIERLWDDPDFEPEHRDLVRAEAQLCEWDRVARQYKRFFEGLVDAGK